MKDGILNSKELSELSALDADSRLALEIAEFVADRAQHFEDHECRAWALTDFEVWAVLGGQSARLSIEPESTVLSSST